MLWNFIKGALRHISSHRTFTSINILGLAIGIACTLIICLYVLHEISYDKFHTGYDRIYRVTVHGQLHDIKFDGATTSGPMTKAIYTEVNGVEKATRVVKFGAWLIANGDIRYNEDNLYFVDTNFLKIFDGFKVLRGNADSMFYGSHCIVLTKKTALKYFGTIDVVGKKLTLESREKPFIVSGVLANPPTNTHIPFDMLGTLVTYEKNVSHWTTNNVYTYIKLEKGVSADSVLKQLNGLAQKYVLGDLEKVFDNAFAPGDKYVFGLQRLTDIHLHSDLSGEMEQNGKAVYVYAFGIVALLILLIACLNFMNLSSANSINRSQEVILRKVSGATRIEIVAQFLVESVIFSGLSLMLALLLTELILPAFNSYLNLNLEFHVYKSFITVISILVFALVLGLISGSYPAYFISSFEPAKIIQGIIGRGVKNSKIRSIFVVVQFSSSILIITLTIIIFSQTRHMMHKDLGFDKEHVIIIRRSDALKTNIDKFKKDISRNPDVLSASNSNSIPGRDFYNATFKLKGNKENTTLLLNQVFVNYDFCEAYNLDMVQGRFFEPNVPSDTFACIINETAARVIGLSYPVGSVLEQPRIFKNKSTNYTIIGVVKDFNFQSVEKPVQPLIMCFMPGNWEGYVNVKIRQGNVSNTISYIERIWTKYAPDYPFVYFHLDEDFNRNYNSLIRLGRIFLIFSILAVFVASMGLFGLISYILNQRVREIGIRKALGATVPVVVVMLIKETLQLLAISTVIAWVIAYFFSSWWLDSFYYRISPRLIYFIFSYIIVLFFSLSVVTFKAYKAAVNNVGDSLKYE